MNRLKTHLNTRLRVRRSTGAGLVLAALAAGTLLTGCGTGQISQTADQAPAVNGNGGSVGELALRDVRIQAEQSSGDFLQPGRTVDLAFVVTNQSTESADELTGISTEIGKVSLTGSKKVPADGALVVGPVSKESHTTAGADKTGATVTLDKPITNGLTYDFTFDFKNAGKLSLAVPISAGVQHQHEHQH